MSHVNCFILGEVKRFQVFGNWKTKFLGRLSQFEYTIALKEFHEKSINYSEVS